MILGVALGVRSRRLGNYPCQKLVALQFSNVSTGNIRKEGIAVVKYIINEIGLATKRDIFRQMLRVSRI